MSRVYWCKEDNRKYVQLGHDRDSGMQLLARQPKPAQADGYDEVHDIRRECIPMWFTREEIHTGFTILMED